MTKASKTNLIFPEVIAKMAAGQKLGLTDAQQLFDEIKTLPPQDLDAQVLKYLDRFDDNARTLLCCLFDPRLAPLFRNSEARKAFGDPSSQASQKPVDETNNQQTTVAIPGLDGRVAVSELDQDLPQSFLRATDLKDGSPVPTRMEVLARYNCYMHCITFYRRYGDERSLLDAVKSLVAASDAIGDVYSLSLEELNDMHIMRRDLYTKAIRLLSGARTSESEEMLDYATAQFKQISKWHMKLLQKHPHLPQNRFGNSFPPSVNKDMEVKVPKNPIVHRLSSLDDFLPHNVLMEREMIEGTLPFGTFDRLMAWFRETSSSESAQNRVTGTGHSDGNRKQVFKIEDFGSPTELDRALANAGLSDSSWRQMAICAWLSERFNYPKWGMTSKLKDLIAVQRMIHAATTKLFGTKKAHPADSKALLNVNLGKDITIDDAILFAKVSLRADFGEQLIYSSIAKVLIASEHFLLFEDVMPREELLGPRGEICRQVLPLYLKALVEITLQNPGASKLIDRGSQTGKRFDESFSIQAAHLIAKVSNLLEGVVSKNADERAVLDTLRLSLYDLARQSHPNPDSGDEIVSAINRGVKKIRGGGNGNGGEPGGTPETPPDFGFEISGAGGDSGLMNAPALTDNICAADDLMNSSTAASLNYFLSARSSSRLLG